MRRPLDDDAWDWEEDDPIEPDEFEEEEEDGDDDFDDDFDPMCDEMDDDDFEE